MVGYQERAGEGDRALVAVYAETFHLYLYACTVIPGVHHHSVCTGMHLEYACTKFRVVHGIKESTADLCAHAWTKAWIVQKEDLFGVHQENRGLSSNMYHLRRINGQYGQIRCW